MTPITYTVMLLILLSTLLGTACSDVAPEGYRWEYSARPTGFSCSSVFGSSTSYTSCRDTYSRTLVRDIKPVVPTRWEGNGNVCYRKSGTDPWECFPK